VMTVTSAEHFEMLESRRTHLNYYILNNFSNSFLFLTFISFILFTFVFPALLFSSFESYSCHECCQCLCVVLCCLVQYLVFVFSLPTRAVVTGLQQVSCKLVLLFCTINCTLQLHTYSGVTYTSKGCWRMQRDREGEIYTSGDCFTLEETEYFIHQLPEAHWLSSTRDNRCAEASKTRLPSFVLVTLVSLCLHKLHSASE
jgi:hypothetical protein